MHQRSVHLGISAAISTVQNNSLPVVALVLVLVPLFRSPSQCLSSSHLILVLDYHDPDGLLCRSHPPGVPDICKCDVASAPRVPKNRLRIPEIHTSSATAAARATANLPECKPVLTTIQAFGHSLTTRQPDSHINYDSPGSF